MRGPWRQALPPLVLGAPVAVLSIVMAVLALPTAPAIALAAGITVAHLALAARRAAPLWSFTVVCAAFAGQAAVTGLFLTVPSVLVFPVAVYSVTVYGGRTGGWLAGAGGAAGAGLATWRLVTDASVRAADLSPDPGLVFALLTAVSAASLSLGLYRRIQLAHVAVLERQAEQAEARRAEQAEAAVRRERQRIAREMHDVVSHSLAVIVSQAKGGRYTVDDPGRAGEVLAVIEDTGRHALADMRGLLGVLRPDPAHDPARAAGPGERAAAGGGTEPALGPQPGLRELPQLLRRFREAGLPVTEHRNGTARPLSPAAELAVYRLVQEALTNTVRHGGTEPSAELALGWGRAELTVSVGNGPPGGTTDPEPGSGRGLVGMRERLAAVGGSVTAGPGAEGFTVTARLPYPAPPRPPEEP